jgi:hypothetical protein
MISREAERIKKYDPIRLEIDSAPQIVRLEGITRAVPVEE